MVDEEPEVAPMAEVTPLVANTPIGASTGAFGIGPYGDISEHTGPPEVTVFTPPYREFSATDARSVMITLLPQHYNMIPNPAFRVDGTGWVFSKIEPAPTSFSWRVEHATATAGLNAIIAKTTSTTVDPNPLTAPAYADGQYVKVVSTLAANVTVGWLKINNAATLTVAEAVGAGITITADVPKYDPYNPILHSLDAKDSWVGQSVVCYGTGHLRYRAGTDKFVYVGPLDGAPQNQWDWRRGGPEWMFNVYAKGAGDVRLVMSGYQPIDYIGSTSGPEYQNLISVADPTTYAAGQSAIIETSTGRVWKAITEPAVPSVAPFYEDIGRGPALAVVQTEWVPITDDDDWHRVTVRTRSRVPENEGQVSFVDVWWIDAKIEIRSANNLKISAAMLDPTEYPACAYFDGGMTENLSLDDFLWEGDPNASPSYYYYDRVIRAKWLYQNLPSTVPAGRPYQIFFGSYWRPYVGTTGETILLQPDTGGGAGRSAQSVEPQVPRKTPPPV